MKMQKIIICLGLILLFLGLVLSFVYAERRKPINPRVMRDPKYLLKKDNIWPGIQNFASDSGTTTRLLFVGTNGSIIYESGNSLYAKDALGNVTDLGGAGSGGGGGGVADAIVDGDFTTNGIMLRTGVGSYGSGDTNAGAPLGIWSFAGSPLVAADIETGAVGTTEIANGAIISNDLDFDSTGGTTLSAVSAFVPHANIFNADDVRSSVSSIVGWFKVDSDVYPDGIIIDSVYMQIFSKTTDYQVDVEEWTSDPCPSHDNDIETDLRVNTTSEVEVRGANIDHRVIEGGNWVFINFDDTDVIQQTYIKIKGRIR